jgi:hypothetical protein
MDDNEKYWTNEAAALLKGRKIVAVRYMTNEEAAESEWYGRPLVIWLDDGTHFMAASDEEGNGPGALFTSSKKTPTIPTL